ncbi:MAG: hypothetical protein KAI71_00140 [Candidatus Pacebacteria bacterium]|nr:hypothetical protein [Candidatus Paceibacterota bacterium]
MVELSFDELAEEARRLLNETIENLRSSKTPTLAMHSLRHEMEQRFNKSIPLHKRMEAIRDESDDSV